jgi:hypothetical protein
MAKLSKRKVQALFEAEVLTFMILDGWCSQSVQHAKVGQAALGKSSAVLNELSKRFSEAEASAISQQVVDNATKVLSGEQV